MVSHEHLRRAGIRESEPFSFELRTIDPGGVGKTDVTRTVEKFTGGGFFGSVVLLPDMVLKTSTPDAFHELLRTVNWPVPFPSRASETAAQLDTVAGNILHTMVPALTEGTIITPNAHGYTQILPYLGFAQAIERMHGRGPTLRDNGEENSQIRTARNRIWNLHNELGAEHVGQVHEKNPFGKPNLWLGDNGQIIWLDYLPAFRHTGYLFPFFYYPFHRNIRQAFNSEKPTYNRIHTDAIRKTLNDNNRLFSGENRETVSGLTELYDHLWQKHQTWLLTDPRQLFVTDALERGVISRDTARSLSTSTAAFELFQFREYSRLGVRAFLDAVRSTPLKVFWDRMFLKNAVKFALNPEYRRTQILEHTTLWGLKQAYEHGLVTEVEFRSSLSFVPEHELRTYVGLQLWFLLNSRLIDAATIPLLATAAMSPSPVEAVGAVTVFNTISPGIIRALSAAVVSRMSHVDLRRAAILSLIPMAGNYLSIPAQLVAAYGKEAESLEHYAKRGLVAALSQMFPGGGWGSDLEEKIWNSFR